MKTVESIRQKGKKKHVVIEGSEHEIAFELIGKYRLRPGMELSDSDYFELLDENERVFYDKLALRRLKSMQTEYELATYLEKKGASKKCVRQLLDTYREKKYVDDDAYASYYVEIKKHTEGPRKIEDKLKEKGVSSDIIEKVLNYDTYEIVFDLVKKRIEANRTKNKKKLVLSLKTHVINKGFPLEIVDEALKHALKYYVADEEALLKKDYERLLLTYQKKMDRAKLEPFIKHKLYQKGYAYEDIKKLF
jgi:regulatory protein